MSTPTDTAPALRAAAEAALAVLPVTEALTVGAAGGDTGAVSFPGAAVAADLTGQTTGTLAILVNQELVDALRGSPLGELDLGAAIAPALEAAAKVLGSVAGPGRQTTTEAALATLGAGGALTIVPLSADGAAQAAVVLGGSRAVDTGGAGARGQAAQPARGGAAAMELLHGVEMEVTVELGRSRMTVRELLSLGPGSVIELDRAAGSPADVLVNGRLIARGEIVVIDENFGIRITEILGNSPADAL
ncbi:flagellar motor switch protein FliN [Actinokineospora auranticolor]|uniref:Flagellar motor switch protein FliN/FliY n=1 Tax=Actinokineospora auranticolor TaxID=155976 RepID=A0A2S6GMY5_9PSEU|nr:flagellar motor switch protein FliN [Actinokineospora auranticolor]PPK66491.1 flagellar motor switch protein FliN/FliY [Actinokineospora auranticolor]